MTKSYKATDLLLATVVFALLGLLGLQALHRSLPLDPLDSYDQFELEVVDQPPRKLPEADLLPVYEQKQDTRPTNQQTIFYHAFLHPNNTDRAMEIIEEQLGQVVNSTAEFDGTTVYYNTIGMPLEEAFINRVCQQNNLTCHLLKHHDQGFEKVTLQDLQDYCANQDNSSTVTYMHNKGSYHDTKWSGPWRQSMTSAVTSRGCSEGLKEDMCNVCGLAFAADRFPFFPGNFFTAQCGYINHLLDPFSFETEATNLAKEALVMQPLEQLTFNLMDPKLDIMGMHRYAAEAWVGSHPTLRPCDMGNKYGIRHYMGHVATQKDLKLKQAPRKPVEKAFKRKIPSNARARRREYFLLPGYIFRWYHLYDTAPPESSWVWSYFPDGNMWKSAVKDHGREAFHEKTKGFIPG